MSDGRTWHQFDVAPASGAAAGRLLAAMARLLPGALARGDLSACFFMQKPPGLRLRFAGDGEDVAEVVAALEGPGAAFAPGVYEPETRLFDGPAGLRCAHDAFTADTLAVCAYAAAAMGDSIPAAPEDFSRALCEQLLARLGLDPWEAWDVWMRVLTLRGGDWRAVEPDPRGIAPVQGCDRILADHAPRIDRIAAAIAGPARHRVFPSGIRRILPFWIVFHWNRMGFDGDAQHALAAAIAAARHPRAPSEQAAAAWAR